MQTEKKKLFETNQKLKSENTRLKELEHTSHIMVERLLKRLESQIKTCETLEIRLRTSDTKQIELEKMNDNLKNQLLLLEHYKNNKEKENENLNKMIQDFKNQTETNVYIEKRKYCAQIEEYERKIKKYESEIQIKNRTIEELKLDWQRLNKDGTQQKKQIESLQTQIQVLSEASTKIQIPKALTNKCNEAQLVKNGHFNQNVKMTTEKSQSSSLSSSSSSSPIKEQQHTSKLILSDIDRQLLENVKVLLKRLSVDNNMHKVTNITTTLTATSSKDNQSQHRQTTRSVDIMVPSSALHTHAKPRVTSLVGQPASSFNCVSQTQARNNHRNLFASYPKHLKSALFANAFTSSAQLSESDSHSNESVNYKRNPNPNLKRQSHNKESITHDAEMNVNMNVPIAPRMLTARNKKKNPTSMNPRKKNQIKKKTTAITISANIHGRKSQAKKHRKQQQQQEPSKNNGYHHRVWIPT